MFGNAIGNSIVAQANTDPIQRAYADPSRRLDVVDPGQGVERPLTILPSQPLSWAGSASAFADDVARRKAAIEASKPAWLRNWDPNAPIVEQGAAPELNPVQAEQPRTYRAGDYGGSAERFARALLREQLGREPLRSETAAYTPLVIEANGITNPRRVSADAAWVAPRANAQLGGWGARVYGQDIALGEQLKAQAVTASELRAQTAASSTPQPSAGLLVDPSDGLPPGPTLERAQRMFGVKQPYVPLGQPEVDWKWKLGSSALGMVSDGFGVVQGVAITVVGAGLTGAPEPTTLTKWLGVPLTIYGAATTAKSAGGFMLNTNNFFQALRGMNRESDYVPGGVLEGAVQLVGGSKEAERAAVAVDLAWDLSTGRAMKAPLSMGSTFNPRVAALLQPTPASLGTTSIDAQMFKVFGATWNSAFRAEPAFSVMNLGVKVQENVVDPLRTRGQ
jgi:hypothetical protein